MYIYPGVGLRWSDRTSRSFCPPFVKGCFSSWHLDSNGGYRKTGEKTRVSVSRHLGINNKRWDHLGPLGTMEKCRFFNPRNMCYNFITSKNEGCGFSWYRWISCTFSNTTKSKKQKMPMNWTYGQTNLSNFGCYSHEVIIQGSRSRLEILERWA